MLNNIKKTKPNWSGIPPSTKTWAWGQFKELVNDPYYAGQIQSRIDELDTLSSNTKRQLIVNTQTWEEDINKYEMESQPLKEILLESKQKLQS